MKAGLEGGQSVHVVLAGLPSMIAVLIRDALDEFGLAVEEASTYDEAILLSTDAPGISVVIVPTVSTGLHEAYTESLRQNPSLRCLAISPLPQRVDLFELRLIGADVGRQEVVEAIQAAISNLACSCPKNNT